MNVEKNTTLKKRFDVVRILFRTACPNPVSKISRVKIMGHVFQLWLIEEVFEDSLFQLREEIQDYKWNV